MYRKVAVVLLSLTVLALLSVAVISSPVVDPPTVDAAQTNDPSTILMRITGAGQGEISGGSTQRGHEGWIEVVGLAHEIVSPRDAASGLPTGKRQHKPFVITKEIDKSTPLLFSALAHNENLTRILLEFFQTDPTTGKEVAYTIELRNASIAGIQTEDEAHEIREHVSFVYQKIIWTWVDGGITSEDDWETPVT